jgi:hypothetical protein
MPDLKVPAVLADLYYDLRDRRLLPLVALVLVAIVATPFLLSQGAEEPEESIPVPAAIQALKESGGQRTATLTVVEANPGLRDYRKRLRGREPLDPFRTFGKPSLEGAQLGDGSEEGGGGGSSGSSAPVTSTSTTVKKTKESSKTTSTTKTTPGGTNGSHVVFYAFAIDVRIVMTVDGKQQAPIVRERVLPQTPLPGEKTPVVTFMGPAREGSKPTGKALLVVSDEVRSVEGDATCLSGDETCQLLEVEPGFPEVFTYGEGEDRYAITVLKLGPVVTGHS